MVNLKLNFSILAFLSILVFAQAFTPADSFGRRQLNSCASHSTCDECNSDSSCATINGACSTNPGINIRNKLYDQATQYSNCRNAKAEGYLYMGNNHLSSVELGHEPGASVNDATSLCEWKFVMETFDTVTVKISKDSANYEDLYIYAMTLNGSKYYYLRELSSCDSNEIVIEFSKIKYLSIRSDKMSSLSSYSIYVERTAYSEDLMTSIFVSIVLGLVMMIFATVTFILLFLSCKQWLKERRLRVESDRERRQLVENRGQWIEDTISSMVHGNFNNLVQKFKQENCVICLEDYEKDTKVCITNECSHTFHVNCLRQWYCNIGSGEQLTCPQCKTLNKPKEERRKSFDGVDENIARVPNSNSRVRMENELRVEQI